MAARAAAADSTGYAGVGHGRARAAFPAGRHRSSDAEPFRTARQCRLSSVGVDDPVPMDEAMGNTNGAGSRERSQDGRRNLYVYLAVTLIAAAIYLGCMVSPPSLMDDVDAVQAQIARNMLTSGDWVTARLDGVVYLEKAPLIYWLIAICFKIFGAYDWVARIPVVLAALALAWVTAAFGTWAFGRRAGFYAGLCISTCIGLFLFTRILIPDVMLTGSIALSMWAFLRAIDVEEPGGRTWAAILA